MLRLRPGLRPSLCPSVLPICLVVSLCIVSSTSTFAVHSAHAVQFTQLDACPPSQNGSFCYWAQAVLGPAAQWIAYTDATTYAPFYEYWPSVVVQSADASLRYEVNVDAGGRHHAPSWSFDGRWLAVLVDDNSSETDLWVVDFTAILASSSAQGATLLASAVGMQSVSWSHDGNSLAFARDGQGIWAVPRSGGAAQQVVSEGRSPSWGPDGRLVFERAGDLWIRETDGRIWQLTATPHDELGPAWSPQGDWIAYSSNAAGTWDLWMRAATGGTAVRVTYDKVQAGGPCWSADGSVLGFMTFDGRDAIWLASDLPDWTTRVEGRSWTQVKRLFR